MLIQTEVRLSVIAMSCLAPCYALNIWPTWIYSKLKFCKLHHSSSKSLDSSSIWFWSSIFFGRCASFSRPLSEVLILSTNQGTDDVHEQDNGVYFYLDNFTISSWNFLLSHSDRKMSNVGDMHQTLVWASFTVQSTLNEPEILVNIELILFHCCETRMDKKLTTVRYFPFLRSNFSAVIETFRKGNFIKSSFLRYSNLRRYFHCYLETECSS